MKHVAFLLALITTQCGVLQAAPRAATTREADIAAIRRQYGEINAHLRRYTHVQREVMDQSAEGGEIQAYFQGSAVRKITAAFYGETGQIHTEFYFRDRKLIFVNEVNLSYPTLHTPPKQWKREEQRFYFVGGRLVQWLGKNVKPVADTARLQRQESVLRHDANEWLAMAKERLRAKK